MTAPGPRMYGKDWARREFRKKAPAGGPSEGKAGDEPGEPSTGEPPLPWPEMIPLSETPPALPFPLWVLPTPLQVFVDEGAESVPCPPDYFAIPVLVASAAAIGNSRSIRIKPGYEPKAHLFAAVVGYPGCGKSPALSTVVAPVNESEERMRAAWDAAMLGYQTELEEYVAAKAGAKKRAEGPSPVKPVRPILERCVVGDATVDALVPILRENPRGVLMVSDELTGWMGAMNQFKEGGKGADQQFWLSVWSGETVRVDRKGTHDMGPLTAKDPFVCVVGGVPPDKLGTIRGDGPRQKAAQDGFVDRILFSYPEEVPAAGERWVSIGDAARESLGAALERLRCLQMTPVVEGGVVRRHRPLAIPLDRSARARWEQFTNDIAAERNGEDFPANMVGPWSKLRAYGARLALVVRCLRWACGEVRDLDEGIDGADMERAAALVAYFSSHARKVHARMEHGVEQSPARKLLAWLARRDEPMSPFSRRDAHRALQRDCKTADEVEPVIRSLSDRGYVRPAVPGDKLRPGKPAGPRFEIHPEAYSR